MRAIFVAVAILFVTLGGKAFSAQGLSPQQATPPQIWESREEMHDDYVRRFESAAGFGMSRMLRPPMLDRSGTLDTGRSRYAIEALELVGHLQTDTPAAYVPTAHDASLRLSFDSRALTSFETTALAALRSGNQLVSNDDGSGGALAVMGALRAKESCLKCHGSRKAGDLLGAFTYRLRRIAHD